MPGKLEQDVIRHYAVDGLKERLAKALQAAGLHSGKLTAKELAPIDEFHIGGRAATEYVVAETGIEPRHHVLDVGCGIGGATRYMASAVGCRVTGVDLTPEYIDLARDLAARTGLADRITYMVASALAMPLPDESFDAAVTLHAAMNIRDRGRLYREVARLLKPGARLGVYDVMKGSQEGLRYPVPWAETPDTSHLTSPAETATLLEAAGFSIDRLADRREPGIAFIRDRLAAAASGPQPLGLHLVMGASAGQKLQNMLHNLESGCISPVLIVARRGA